MTAPKKDPFAAKATESKPTAAEKADAKAVEKQHEAEDKVVAAKVASTETPAEEAEKASTNPELNAPDHDKVKTESTSGEVVKRSQTDGATSTSTNTADGTQAPAKPKSKAKKAKTASAAKSSATEIKREELPATIPAQTEDGTFFATVNDKLGHILVSVRPELWVGEAPLNVSLEEAEEVHKLLGEVIKRTKGLKG